MNKMRHVIVESGHMVDAPGRPVPRFPPEAEPRIAAAIDATLEPWQVGPGSVVLTQGARGTDIIIAESALRKGAQVKLLPALPAQELEARSLFLPESRWSGRFQALQVINPRQGRHGDPIDDELSPRFRAGVLKGGPDVIRIGGPGEADDFRQP
jgi:hypothetical protein